MIFTPVGLARLQEISDRLGQYQAQLTEAQRLLASLAAEQDHDHDQETRSR